MHQSRIGLLLPWGTMRYMDMNTYTTLLYMVIYIQHICGGLGVVISQLELQISSWPTDLSSSETVVHSFHTLELKRAKGCI